MKTALIALLLTGCASIPGVQLTDAERVACEAHGCTVWTRAELEQLIRAAIQRGYFAGRKSL
jgi:uncharacterized protein YcfL